MSFKMKYIIDTSSLIELKDTYRKSVFSGAWDDIKDYLKNGIICSSVLVYDELKQQEDDIIFKMVNQFPHIFIVPTEEIQNKVKEILALYPRLIKIKSNKSGADPFVVATAIINKVPVVTNEKKTGDINYPHIPDICAAINHKCYSLADMFEKENIQFIRKK